MSAMKKILLTLLALVAALNITYAQAGSSKDQHNIYSTRYAQEVIDFMTNKKFRGREAGDKAVRPVIDFIVKEFEEAGCVVERQQISAQALSETIGAAKEGKEYPKQMTNIIAKIDGKNPDKLVVVGAHFDHLGKKPKLGIHPGADDNASGVVAILSLAKMIKAAGITPEFTILFCAWDGEEKGLLGSKYFVSDWYANRGAKDTICYYMNFDMVGRTATPAHPAVTFAWNDNYPNLKVDCERAYPSIVQPFKVLYDRRLGDGKGGSDYATFSARNIPFVAWMEDEMHEDYHKPTDTPDKIHWNKLRKTTLLAYEILYGWVF